MCKDPICAADLRTIDGGWSQRRQSATGNTCFPHQQNMKVPLRPFGEVFTLYPCLCGFWSILFSGLLSSGPLRRDRPLLLVLPVYPALHFPTVLSSRLLAAMCDLTTASCWVTTPHTHKHTHAPTRRQGLL